MPQSKVPSVEHIRNLCVAGHYKEAADLMRRNPEVGRALIEAMAAMPVPAPQPLQKYQIPPALMPQRRS